MKSGQQPYNNSETCQTRVRFDLGFRSSLQYPNPSAFQQGQGLFFLQKPARIPVGFVVEQPFPVVEQF